MATPFRTSGPTCSRAGRRRLLLVGPVLLLVALLWGPLSDPASAATASTTTTPAGPVTPVVVSTGSTLTSNGPFQGLGVQDDNNLLWSATNERLGANGIKDYASVVVPRLQAIHPAIVRKMIDLTWLFPGSPTPAPRGRYDPADPRTYRPGESNAAGGAVYTPHSVMMQALYTDLNVLKRMGTTVLLTIWQTPIWMDPAHLQQPHVPKDTTHAGAPDAAHLSIYAADIAQLVALLHRRGYTNVAYVSAPNELDQGQFPIDVHTPACPNIAPYSPGQPTLESTTVLLHRDLAAQHLAVGIFGPDTGRCEAVAAATDRNLKKLLAFYDYHDFNTLSCSVSWARQIVDAAAASGHQVWITEFAGQGGGSCDQPPTPQGDVWEALVPKAISAVNAGVASINLWSTSGISYGRGLGDQAYYGLWGPPTTDKSTSFRINLGYYPWAEMTKETYNEHKVFASSCQNALGCDDVLAAFLGNGKGHTTAMLFNAASSPRSLRVTFRTKAKGRVSSRRTIGPSTYTRYVTLPSSTVQTLASPGNPDLPKPDGVVHRTNGSLQVTLPGGSFTLLSN